MLFLVLLLVSLAGAVIAAVLAVRGLIALLRRSGRPRLRTAALLAGAGFVAMYAWGMLHVTYAVMSAEDGGTGSAPIDACRDADPELAPRVDGYEVSYLPLRFACHLGSGGTYVSSAVPGYVNPAATVLGLITAASWIRAATTAKRTRPPETYAVDRADPR